MSIISHKEHTLSERLLEITHWLRAMGITRFEIAPASSDASFRCYFRIRYDGQTLIIMDAPPGQEDCRPFITIARAFFAIGLNVPEVLEADLGRGLLLLSDLGTRQYLDALDASTADRLYGDALQAIVTLQARCLTSELSLPLYDHALLMREMALFREWLVEKHLALALDAGQSAMLDQSFEQLAQSALEQPRVCVHRDFHSRNLIVTGSNNPGIVDFQDAVIGPVTYDLVSLLRDCYIVWPGQRIEVWVEHYRSLAQGAGVSIGDSSKQFLRWFDLMGIQRHLKAAGIFARLNARDGKPGYLKDIPRTLNYVVEVSRRYPELDALHALLRDVLVPRMESRAS